MVVIPGRSVYPNPLFVTLISKMGLDADNESVVYDKEEIPEEYDDLSGSSLKV